MKSGLATRVDRIASRVAKTTTVFPTIICKEYDREDSEIVGLRVGTTFVPKQSGETIDCLLERARAATGVPMWAADYGDIDRFDDWFSTANAENRNAGGPVE